MYTALGIAIGIAIGIGIDIDTVIRGAILINYPNNHQIAMLALSSSVVFVSYGRCVTEKLNQISVNTKMCYKTSHKDSQTG